MKMRCLECGSEAVTERPERTAQGYRRFRCRACAKQFNERSGGALNRTQDPSDVIALVVLWRLRDKLALLPCCMDRRYGRIEPYPCSGSCGADILRASQLQHSVQHVGGDRHLGCLSPVGLEA